MSQVFGEVAALYDDVRPGYPDAVRGAILDYAGQPGSVVEAGAGTGKGTALFARLGAPLTAIEPDPRMAAVLRTRFPEVEVVASTFEEWVPPAGGVDLIGCALAWHWVDAGVRNPKAFGALVPGGTLVVVGRRYGYRDPEVRTALDDFYQRLDGNAHGWADHWIRDDLAAYPGWSDLTEREWHEFPEFSTERYLALHETFGPFRKRTPEVRQRMREELSALVDGFGGSLVLDLVTIATLARRP